MLHCIILLMNEIPAFHRPETWDDRSKDYEQLAEPSTRRFAIALADRVRVDAGERVIDIACGPGALSLHLAGLGARMMAVDHSPAMVARLLGRAEAAGVRDRIDGAAMDGQALTFADNSFDVALSAFGIFLFPDNRAGLREAVRVVRPGGRVGIATWQGEFGAGPSLLLHRGYAAMFPDRPIVPPSAGAAAWGDPEVLRQALLDAGLVDVSVAEHVTDWSFPDGTGEQADRLFQMFPSWVALDAGEREQLTAAIDASLRKNPAVPTTALLATGRKPD